MSIDDRITSGIAARAEKRLDAIEPVADDGDRAQVLGGVVLASERRPLSADVPRLLYATMR